MNNRIEKAKYALVFYMRSALDGKIAFDEDNEREIRTIVDDIVEGIMQEIKKGD